MAFARPRAVAKAGAVSVVQRASSDLRLNPHLHAVFIDGAYREEGETLVWSPIGHLQTPEVGAVLEKAVRRMANYLQRRQALALAKTDDIGNADGTGDDGPEGRLESSAVTGQTPPCGPQWLRGLAPLAPRAMAYDKPLCASLDGFTFHSATHAGTADLAGHEALLRYVLRPPIAQERVEAKSDGLVRLTLKRAYADGTVAVEMAPSLLSRLAASVPPPPARRRHPPPPRAPLLTNIGEATEPPARSPNRGPPYWQSTVLRRSTFGDAA